MEKRNENLKGNRGEVGEPLTMIPVIVAVKEETFCVVIIVPPPFICSAGKLPVLFFFLYMSANSLIFRSFFKVLNSIEMNWAVEELFFLRSESRVESHPSLFLQSNMLYHCHL